MDATSNILYHEIVDIQQLLLVARTERVRNELQALLNKYKEEASGLVLRQSILSTSNQSKPQKQHEQQHLKVVQIESENCHKNDRKAMVNRNSSCMDERRVRPTGSELRPTISSCVADFEAVHLETNITAWLEESAPDDVGCAERSCRTIDRIDDQLTRGSAQLYSADAMKLVRNTDQRNSFRRFTANPGITTFKHSASVKADADNKQNFINDADFDEMFEAGDIHVDTQNISRSTTQHSQSTIGSMHDGFSQTFALLSCDSGAQLNEKVLIAGAVTSINQMREPSCRLFQHNVVDGNKRVHVAMLPDSSKATDIGSRATTSSESLLDPCGLSSNFDKAALIAPYNSSEHSAQGFPTSAASALKTVHGAAAQPIAEFTNESYTTVKNSNCVQLTEQQRRNHILEFIGNSSCKTVSDRKTVPKRNSITISGMAPNAIYTKVGTIFFRGIVQHDGNNAQFKHETHPFSAAVINTFRNTFGFETQLFRTNQLEVINAALLGYDCFVLKPTGAGKSLCYQLPACVQPGVSIVISPLRSLIQDQTNKLRSLHITCAALTSGCLKSDENRIYADLESAEPKIKMLYITPEKLNASPRLQSVLQKTLYLRGLLNRIVIDEAHCVSSWGHDFRLDYAKIKIVKEWFPSVVGRPRVPMMALTATANPRVRHDILQQLGMSPSETKWFIQSFNRPNLRYEVRVKKSSDTCRRDLLNVIQSPEFADQTGIVYCLSRKDCDELASWLMQNNINAVSYHAGLNDKERSDAQKRWSDDKVKVACATIAFGMGIDKYDVRFVVHHSLPKSVEGYYHECGRAGRDGLPALCLLYYSWADVIRLRKLISQDLEQGNAHSSRNFMKGIVGGGFTTGSTSRKEPPIAVKSQHFANLKSVIGYCESTVECRRTQLLDYFGEIYDAENCGAGGSGGGSASLFPTVCDNCEASRTAAAAGRARVMHDFTEDAKNITAFVLRDNGTCVTTNQNKRITLMGLAEAYTNPPVVNGDVAGYFVASNAYCTTLTSYSKDGPRRPNRNDVVRLLRLMIAQNILEEPVDLSTSNGSAFLHAAPASSELMCGNLKLVLDVVPEKFNTVEKATASWQKKTSILTADNVSHIADRAAMVELCKIELRNVLASARIDGGEFNNRNYSNAYDVCSSDILTRIAYIMPRSEHEFLAIAGVSRFVYEQVGEAFLSITARYADKCIKKGLLLGTEGDYNVEDPMGTQVRVEEDLVVRSFKTSLELRGENATAVVGKDECIFGNELNVDLRNEQHCCTMRSSAKESNINVKGVTEKYVIGSASSYFVDASERLPVAQVAAVGAGDKRFGCLTGSDSGGSIKGADKLRYTMSFRKRERSEEYLAVQGSNYRSDKKHKD